MIGTRFGPYQIVGSLGAGGMGHVYRARDTKLGRDVALKVLPDLFTSDPDRLARFTREAQILATLNHPNIAAIYGAEDAPAGSSPSTSGALVMELVEGPTLEDRLEHGSLAVEEALPIAKQIAEALEAAHDLGIVHRDLKPANIKVRPDGTVKVLDFGLAKALDVDSTASGRSVAATITSPALVSGAGVILGTAAYMSPEQAKGKPVDRRADIWAFGCVLYEMITGRRLYSSDAVSETLAAVIMKEPDWTALPASTPANIRSLLLRCLDKDPKSRLRDIGEARVAIDRAGTSPAESSPSDTRSPLRWLPWAVAAAALGVATFVGLRQPQSSPPPVTRFSLHAPQAASFITPAAMLAVSPDGRSMAFVAVDTRGTRLLWTQRLDSLSAVPLKGTEDAWAPFWSPDSRYLGFFANQKLMVVEVVSGRLQAICGVRSGEGGTWREDGLILFAGNPGDGDGVYQVRVNGGQPIPVFNTQSKPQQSQWRSPVFLPGGNRFLYVAHEQEKTWHAYLADLDTRATINLFDTQSKVEYAAPGWLFYVYDGRLLAVRFDSKQGSTTGEPLALTQNLLGSADNARKAFSVSSGGVLAFRESPGTSEIIVYNRAGKPTGTIGKPGDTYPVALSPDDKRVLFRRNGDVWIAELGSAKETRVTFEAANRDTPVWSPDGTSIGFVRGGQVWRTAADGGGQPQALGSAFGTLLQWTSSGFLSDRPIKRARLEEKWEPKTIPGIPDQAQEGQISPDGKWLAYTLDERGTDQLYVQSLSAAGGRWQVSKNGGRQPRWRKDGKELFYFSSDGFFLLQRVKADYLMSPKAISKIGYCCQSL